MRQKLKFKILSQYGLIKTFAEEIGYTRSQLNAIINKKLRGSDTFWGAVQRALNISDDELRQYINDHNYKRRK